MRVLLLAIFLLSYAITVFGKHPLEGSLKYLQKNRNEEKSLENIFDEYDDDYKDFLQLFQDVEITEELHLLKEGTPKGSLLNVSAIDLYLPTHASSPSCIETLKQLKYPENRQYTKRMVDSWGKFSDGIYTGNYNPIGIYDECIQLTTDILKTRYCYVHVSKNDGNQVADTHVKPDPQVGIIFVDLDRVEDTHAYGTCMPQNCTQNDLEESLNIVFEPIQHSAYMSCVSSDDEDPLTSGDISFIVFLSVVGFISILATALDAYSSAGGRTSLSKGIVKKCTAFSISSNMRKIFGVPYPTPKGNITCIHGIRSLSMAWVFYCHQFVFSKLYMSNVNDIPDRTDSFIFQIIFNGYYSVDSFFFISGLLVSYLTFKSMDRNKGRINFLLFYLHRYMRLTPLIAFTAWFQATIARYFVRGPFQSDYQYTDICRNWWWTDVIYVNNYVNNKRDCIPQAWYTAADTQIFIFTPLVLLPLYHFRRFGKVLLGFVTLVFCIIPGSITVAMDFPPFYKYGVKNHSYWNWEYVAPFSRASPYLVGIGAGYFIYSWGDRELKLKPWHVAVGWILSISLSSVLVLSIWKYNILTNARVDYSAGFQFFYGGFSKALWGVCLAWIVIACHYGYGGLVNLFLSHPAFLAVSKLTYPMYILGLGVQCTIVYSIKQFYYFNQFNMLKEALITLLVLFIVAIVVSVFIELPIMTLEREFLRPPDKSKQSKTKNIEEPNHMENSIEIHSETKQIPSKLIENNIEVHSEEKQLASTPTESNIVIHSEEKQLPY